MIVIDRIEGNRAVLEIDGEMIEISTNALPADCREGAVLSFTLCDDGGADLQRENQERLERLRAQDPGDMEIDI